MWKQHRSDIAQQISPAYLSAPHAILISRPCLTKVLIKGTAGMRFHAREPRAVYWVKDNLGCKGRAV